MIALAKMSTVETICVPIAGADAPPTGVGIGTLVMPAGPRIVLVLSDGNSAHAAMLDADGLGLLLDKLAVAVASTKDAVVPQHEPEARR